MFKLFVFYNEPPEAEKAAFDEYYRNTHIPLCQKIPGIVRFEADRFSEAMAGSQAPYYMVAILTFNNKEEYDAGMASPEGRAVRSDTRNFPKGILSMAMAESVE